MFKMAVTMSTDITDKAIEEAYKAGQEFAKLFYDTLDKKRHLIGNIFQDDSTLIWDGNKHVGQTSIAKFFESLPVSRTDLFSVDCQPMSPAFVQGQTVIQVLVSGEVRYKENSPMTFSESFVLVALDNRWKIMAETLRFHKRE